MNLDYRYQVRSGVSGSSEQAQLHLATNQLREAVFFRGTLREPLMLREALGSLWQVVTSDLKWRVKPRLAYRAWLATQDQKFIAEFGQRSHEAKAQMHALQLRLQELDDLRAKRRTEFNHAKRRWMDYAVKNWSELNLVLDPVITVHPDQLSFEAFSRDQSSYARLGLAHSAFAQIDAFECGTTNIDYSAALHDHFDRLRSYRLTQFELGSSGFASSTSTTVETPTAGAVFEKRIALPEGWMQGFLRVHGLMSMGLQKLRLAPIDVVNVLNFLARHKTKVSPRALRFELRPEMPVRLVLEPWNHSIWCSPSSVYRGHQPQTIRVWGRDRLQVLQRVLPLAEYVDVYLAGNGLPSVWHLGLGGGVDFSLALSGWTDNDWVEGEARFDQLTRRSSVSAAELERTYVQLRSTRWARLPELAQSVQLTLEQCRSAVSILCEAGRAMLDLANDCVRHRDLLLTPFSASQSLLQSEQAQQSDPKAKLANELVQQNTVRIIARRAVPDGYKLSGNAPDGSSRVRPLLHLSSAGEIISASCTCTDMTRHGLTHGPCAHVLALRLAHLAKLGEESGA